MSLVECRTGTEVIENFKAVRARVRSWKKPEPIPIAKVLEAAPSLNAQPAPFIPPAPMRPYTTPIEPAAVTRPTLAAILKAVSVSFRVSVLDIISHRRQRQIVVPRQVVMYLGRRLTIRSYPDIGRVLGGRDHTTCMHGASKIEQRRLVDPDLDLKLTEIEAEVMGVSNV